MSALYEYQLNATQSIIVRNCDKVNIENVDGKFVITIQEQKVKDNKVNVKKEKRIKLFNMSTQLCEFLEVPYDTHMSRKEIVKKMNQYIFKNKLKNKEHKNQFIVNDKLKELFGLTNETSIKIYHASKYLKNHILSEYKEEKKEVSEKCPFKECPSFKEAFEKCPSFKEAFEKCPKMKDVKNCPFMNDCEKCPFYEEGEERAPNKIADPVPISDELCDFLGVEHGTQMSRIDVIKEVNTYIKTHDLTNREEKGCIILDEKLQKLLSPPEGETVKFLTLYSYLKKHFPKSDA